MRTISLIATGCLWVSSAWAAEPITLAGKFGYLNEYEVSARLGATDERGGYSGALLVRHVGLCSHDGPQEMAGEISLKQERAGAAVTAILAFNGRRCTFSGSLSEGATGELTCPDASVPASLWPREQ